MKHLGNLLKGENCSMLFFILVFLFLFTKKDGLGNLFCKKDGECIEGDEKNDCSILFFIIVFLLLFSNDKGCIDID
jgi:hypothetical protein